MLNAEVIKKIEDSVYSKPRSIQEIAEFIRKNWRTADRYVAEIEKEFGTIATRTFREGTRGALKIVYWAAVEKISHSIIQQKLEEALMHAKKKEEFSAFDIYQYIADNQKEVSLEEGKEEGEQNVEGLIKYLNQAKKQVFIFSGNLSLVNLKRKDADLFACLEQLVKQKISIKIIARVDIAGKENVEKMLSLNFKYGKEMVEIHHRDQPLRAFIIDNKVIRIKEVSEPTGKIHELNKRMFIYYTIKDKEWTEWLTRLFWKMFSTAIAAEKRLEEMRKIL
ncbi:hypothetical protein J4447_04970 [Candidatus Pacearchaeota archaeon]|nr:hypothetical protein [Candidatus Pacearchaeota archaeon]